MPNMSYCRFQNTKKALNDCFRVLQDNNYDLELLKEELSDEEFQAMQTLIETAKNISENMEEK